MIIGMLLVAVAGVAAVTPGVPEAFYGTVTINGNPAPNGVIITAKVYNQVQGTGTTQDGKYGYNDQPFKVADPSSSFESATITFYVNNVKAQTATYQNGQVTKLDLSVTTSTPPSGGTTGGTTGSTGGSSGGGGAYIASTGSSGSSGTSGTSNESNATVTSGSTNTTASQNATCTPDWTCSDWTACSNNVKKRVCVDSNKCGTDSGRPNLTESCGQTPAQILKQTNSPPGRFTQLTGFVTSTSGAGALIFLVAIALIVGVFFWNKNRTKE